MKKRFTEEQIVKMLQSHREGRSISEVCREAGIAENTFYNWQRKYGGLEVSEVRRMRGLEEENTRLKRLVADLSLENMVQKEVIKNFSGPEC